MPNTQSPYEASADDALNRDQNANAQEYQTLRGCLSLIALVAVCVIISVLFMFLFGKPAG